MSSGKFSETLKGQRQQAAPRRAVPATRQGRVHVGVYVDPEVAYRLRVLAVTERTTAQKLIEDAIERLLQERAPSGP